MGSYFQALNNTKILHFAHRGYWGYDGLIQNTIPAFIDAIKHNAHFIECDVFATKDNRLVLHHDADIKLYRGETVLIEKLTMNELNQLYIEKEIPYAIPLLQELLDLIDMHHIGLNIELKGNNVAKRVFQLLQLNSQQVRDKVIISSFSDQQLFLYRDLDAAIDMAILREGQDIDLKTEEEWQRLQATIYKLKPVSISIANQDKKGTLLQEHTVQQLRDLRHDPNMRVGVYTVNSKERLEELYGYGCSYFFSDKRVVL